MDKLVEAWDNIVAFPWVRDNSELPVNSLVNIELEEWTVEYHNSRWLDLFKANHSLSSTRLLVDNQSELIRIDTEWFVLDWHSNILELLSSPSNSENLIRAREAILDQINALSEKLRTRLYESRNKVLKLNWFRDNFYHLDDLEWIIKDLEKLEWSVNCNSIIFARLLFTFDWLSYSEFEELRQLIPWHLLLIRNISWDFFTKIADDLSELYKKASIFSLADIKRIFEEKDYEAFISLKSGVEVFCDAYSHWDWILIASNWARNGYIETVKTIETKSSDTALSVRDPRQLLVKDIDWYLSCVPNDLPNQSSVEVYSWLNGSWKSTWLKSRLMLQLFYQTYWKVSAKDAELMLRDQIVFINRWGSCYWEDLSAFWNDVKRKLMAFLPNLQNWALIFLDEFWSTIPEEEAYYLIRALLDYLNEYDAKVYLASHNEMYINWASQWDSSKVQVYSFRSKSKNDWTMDFSYKMNRWRDNAHSLKVFKAAWLPGDILRKAGGWMLGQLQVQKPRELSPYRDVVSYSNEERKLLKQENKWFAWFSRLNDMVKVYNKRDRNYYRVVRKYRELWYEKRPKSYYSPEDLFLPFYDTDNLDQDSPKISFDFMRYWTFDKWNSNSDPLFIAKHLESKGINRKDIYSSWKWTLSSLITWWLTSDIKELQERQRFFAEIWDWSYEDANKVNINVNAFTYILNNFQNGSSLNFDYKELSRFNKAYWSQFINGLEQYIATEWLWRVCEWFLILVDMEDKLGNLPEWFREENKDFLLKLHQKVDLSKRYNRAEKRSRYKFKDKYKTSAELAERVCEKVQETLTSLFWIDIKQVMSKIIILYSEIDSKSLPVDILSLDPVKRTDVITFLDESRVFQNPDPDYWETILYGFHWMMKVISVLKGSGNLLQPLLSKLRSFDSIHAHQISNYIEDFINLPDVEYFIELVRQKRDNPKFCISDNHINLNRELGWIVMLELLWLINIANQIKNNWWTQVSYNSTWEIDVRWMVHPWVELKTREQVKNNVYLWESQSFDILEWATMWWKTFNIQAMHWIIRLSHSIWFVPAESANLPVFDWLVYIDRVLEDEKRKLSAWQNDAKAWAEIITKIRTLVKNKSENWRYWFSIDEMISSVPARFQRWLVSALLEELTALGQKWQISIHNPELVSRLIENNPESYNVRHPEVEFDEAWWFDYTYRINNGRSIDKDGNFTAYSLETAEKMWLPKEIIDRARVLKTKRVD